jgi:tetratricopeptide (TPR) repeat protein
MTQSIALRAALVAAFLFLVHTAAFAQTGLIRGKVVGPDGKPVQGAVVTIEFQGGVNRAFTAKTDKKGEFTQLGLQSGTYKVTATADKMTAVGQANVRVGNTAEVNLALAPPAGDAAAAQVRKVFDEGNALVQAKDWDGAVAKFEEAAGIIENCADCYYNIGFVHMQRKDDAKAEAAYKKALELKPDHTESLNALATLYNSQKRFDEAAAISAKAAAGGGAGGGSADAIYNQGIILWNAGKIAEAKEKFQQTIAANPNHASGHFQLGMAMLNTGEVAPAVTEFETYLKLEPSGQFAAQAKQMVDQLKK